MKSRLTRGEYDQLQLHLAEVDHLQELSEQLHQQIRHLLGCHDGDGELASDRIFDMVFNEVDAGETLHLLGLTWEDAV